MDDEATGRFMPAGAHDTVFACFARQAQADPLAVAVIDERGHTTYGELAARADALARHLRASGCEPGQPVGVLMERRGDLLAVLLAIWKAGAAYVPFDPRDPPERVRRMAVSCGITVCIGDPGLLLLLRTEFETAGVRAPLAIDPAVVEASAIGTKTIDAPVSDGPVNDGPVNDASVNGGPACAPAYAIPALLPPCEGGAQLAYLLFTSGSTGEPKAVEVEHRHVLALLVSACELLRFGPRDRYLAASTIAFDASITELFLPLVTGASLVLRDRAILLEPHRLARDVREQGITVLQTGPSVWQVLLDEVRPLPRLRIAITHGEAVSPSLARRIAAVADEAWNLYGPTETTVWATGECLRIDAPDGLSGTSAPIGRPLAHVRALVVDEQGLPVADGTPGELYLGGPSVARGYRNNAALTADRFVVIGGERLYRSGDVVVRDAGGALHYFGRNDDQIKVRGIRVEPGEIEAAILHDPRVTQAAATWYLTNSGTRAVVAAIVLRKGASCGPRELHDQLAARLPPAMIPARFLFVPWLPMTTSGKVDRKAIRAAAEASDAPGAPAGRPLTYTEVAVARIWQRMLGLAAVAHDDHFFSIGGDSLSAVQMMLEVETRFGLVLPVHLAFEAPTLEALAGRIDRAREPLDDEAGSGFVYPLVNQGTGAPLFFSGVELSLARRGVWAAPCPLYAIANWAMGSGIVQAESLQALAAQHVAAIRRIQPHGPYRLAGFSMGGLIAFEMAQQLRASGQEVEFLFLLDPMPPNGVDVPDARVSASAQARGPALSSGPAAASTPPESGGTDPLGRRIARHVRQFRAGPGDRKPREWAGQMLMLHRLSPVIEWLYYLAVNHYLRHPNAASRLLFPRDRWRAFRFAAQRMVRHYKARPYEGRVQVVFCRQDARGALWNSLIAPDAIWHSLDVPHLELFDEPALGRWMAWLSEHIEAGGNGLASCGETSVQH